MTSEKEKPPESNNELTDGEEGHKSVVSPKVSLKKTETETRARALGTLLHMVQDSYAGGHVKRVPASDGQPAGIAQFLSYVNQDEDKHAHDDSWQDGDNDLTRSLNIPGARSALTACTELVKRYNARESWPAVEAYLKNGPFFVRSDAVVSGPGDYE